MKHKHIKCSSSTSQWKGERYIEFLQYLYINRVRHFDVPRKSGFHHSSSALNFWVQWEICESFRFPLGCCNVWNWYGAFVIDGNHCELWRTSRSMKGKSWKSIHSGRYRMFRSNSGSKEMSFSLSVSQISPVTEKWSTWKKYRNVLFIYIVLIWNYTYFTKEKNHDNNFRWFKSLVNKVLYIFLFD